MAHKAVHGEVEGRRSQGGAKSRRSQVVIQRPARTSPQGRVEGGRIHGGDLMDDTLGTTNGDVATV